MALILVFLVIAAVFTNSTVADPICNPEHQFSCGTSCIPIEFRCDNIVDCPSAHDEVDCNYLHPCPTNEFMCRSGECIPRDQKCNGFNDCSDATDEAGCMDVKPASATWMIVLWILVSTLAVFTVFICYIFNRYPSLHHRAELVVGTSVPLISPSASFSNPNILVK